MGIGFIYQLVTPSLILEDNTEQKIQTFNDNYMLCQRVFETNFNLKLWYHVIPKAKKS